MTLVPAYGKDYPSGKAAKEAFDAGRDFQIADISSPDDGRYVNKPQFSEDLRLPAQVQIRFKRETGVCVAHTRKSNATKPRAKKDATA